MTFLAWLGGLWLASVGLLVLLVGGTMLRMRLQTRAPRVHDLIYERPIEEVRLMPGVDAVPEGLGVVRPWPVVIEITPFADLHTHSPVTPLAYLDEDEWTLWTSVIAESAR